MKSTFNKKSRIIIPLFLSLLLTAAIGCLGGGDDSEDKDVTISGYVNGAGVALKDAVVKIGEKSDTTADSGKFSIEVSSNDVVETKAGTIFSVEVTATGYGSGYAKVIYLDDKTEYSTEVKLLPVTDEITEGDDITNGVEIKQSGTTVGEITIPESSFPEGVTGITGNVTYIDPTTPAIVSAPGGDFLAVRSGGSDNMVSLDSLGMMEFELKDQDGNPVTELQGAGATLKMRVPAGVSASAGDTVPLWWYNTETGLWQEEGSGTVINDGGQLWISGAVTHFTWWNYDHPIEEHSCFEFSVVDSATNNSLDFSWHVEGVTYIGTSPSRQCNCNGTDWSTFTVKISEGAAEQVRVYTIRGGIRYYLVEDTAGTAYSLSTTQGDAKVFNTPTAQGSCLSGTLTGTALPLDGQDGIIPLGGINYAPEISSINSDTPNPVSQGATVQFSTTITDPEGDAVDVNWEMQVGMSTVSPDSVSFTGGIATADFTIPATLSQGLYSVMVTATDSNGYVSTASTAIWMQGNGTVEGLIRCGNNCGPDIDAYSPLPGATVELFLYDGEGLESLYTTVTSGPDGMYSITGVPTTLDEGGERCINGYIHASFTNDGTEYEDYSGDISDDGDSDEYSYTVNIYYVGGGGS
ncbi:MAG: hypothetical protein GY754_31185 [bacterium]|nr:hypothetical protein [bacterium]